MTLGHHFTTDLIEQIRAYQSNHEELLRSHHFVFDCPLDHRWTDSPRYVWIGINPGSDDEDWERLPENTEQTRDFDFQAVHGRSTGSKARLAKLEKFVGQEVFLSMTHSQWFFWGRRTRVRSSRRDSATG